MKITATQVSKHYGNHPALQNLSLDLPDKTRCLALIGPSGGGKSTLLRLLGGLEVPDLGALEINGLSLPRSEPALRTYRRKNGFLFQGYNLFPHLTARQNIALPLIHVHGMTQSDAEALADSHLERFGLANHGSRLPSQLSGGQQQRVALIRSIAPSPELLFLDEPTAALDPEMTVEVLELIRALILGGQEVVVSTHEMGFARALADVVAFVSSGTILEASSPATIFEHPTHPEVAHFLGRVLEFR